MWKSPSLGLILALAVAPAFATDLGVGRAPTDAELQAWNMDVRPDGKGLPKGHGTAAQGEEIYQERCATCHGEFGEGAGRWPELAGGQGSLTGERPLKTVGSFWPYTSTLFDFVQRAMPFGNARSLTYDETYAVVAYILNLNDVIKDTEFELNETNLATVRLPNEKAFYDDDRDTTERAFWRKDVCMKDCKPEVHITGRAAILDVTPDNKTAPKVE
ncbi:MAG: c-type cytochrome [Acetobacteraceae bacterium]